MARTPLFRSVGRIMSLALAEEAAAKGLKFTRREGLKAGAVTAMASYLAACNTVGRSHLAGEKGLTPSGEEVVIIGGGVAGLSAAYYLKKAGVASRIYEANDRLGGRIWTQYDFNKEGMFCERGGELIDTGHKEIQNLMVELGLELQRLPDPVLPSEVRFFHGKFRTEEELVEGFRPWAARIAADAMHFMVDGEFQMPTYKNPISDAVKKLDAMSLATYLYPEGFGKFDNADKDPDWVRSLIRVAYTGEYGLDISNQSAINLVSFIATDLAEGFKMFGESDELFRIKGGNSSIIKALTEKVKGQYETGHKLISIAQNSKAQFQLIFDVKGNPVEVLAKTCVITIPFTVLREVQGINKIGLTPRKLKAIRELGYGTNSKLMLGFKSRYWRQEGKDFPANDGALVTGLEFQGGWETSRFQEGTGGIFTNFMGGDHAKNFTLAKVQATLDNLDAVYPGIKANHDNNVLLQPWPSIATAKGSYICQKPGQYTTITGCFGEPECKGQLLFAGEHTSEVAAGFMNGAVESGLKAAATLIEKLPQSNELIKQKAKAG